MVSIGSQGYSLQLEADVSEQGGRQILVLATRQADGLRLCEILTSAGYVPHWPGDPLRAVEWLPKRDSHDDYVATVLCHRTDRLQTEAALNAGYLLNQLPVRLRRNRVIAVSDCTAEHTVVALLDDGAHHCFNLLESPRLLQVRFEAALRWHGRSVSSPLAQGDIRFDLEKRQVTRSGSVIELSPKEFALACYLFENRDRVVGNAELLTSIWSLPAGMDTRRIDTAACRVRKKLRLTPEFGWELKRLRRVGFRLVRAQLASLEGS